MISKWKQEFLDRSAEVFDKKSDDETDVDTEKLYSKIGQLEMENDFLKKKLKQDRTVNQLRKLVDTEHGLSVRQQCDLLEIHRSGLYYKPCGEKPENLKIMRLMDEHYLEHPTEGSYVCRIFFWPLVLW